MTPLLAAALIVSGVMVVVLWEGPQPTCEVLGRDIVTYASTLEKAAAKAQQKAAKRGATHLWVRKGWINPGKVEAVALRCPAEGE